MILYQPVFFLFNSSSDYPITFISLNNFAHQIWGILNIPLNSWSTSQILKTYSFRSPTYTIISFMEFSKSFLNYWNIKLLFIFWTSMGNKSIFIKRYKIINNYFNRNSHNINKNFISTYRVYFLCFKQSFYSFRELSNCRKSWQEPTVSQFSLLYILRSYLIEQSKIRYFVCCSFPSPFLSFFKVRLTHLWKICFHVNYRPNVSCKMFVLVKTVNIFQIILLSN